MSIYQTTLKDMVKLAFQLCLGNWWEGTATAGAVGTLTDTDDRGEPDDFFQSLDAYIKILTTTDDAAPKGEVRRITDFVNSTSVITFSPNMSAAPADNDTYAIYAGYSWAEVVAAINAAIDRYAKVALVEQIDQSVQLQKSVYEYAIPTGFIYLYRLTMANGSGQFPYPIPPDQYRIVRGTNPPMIHFYRFPEEGQVTDTYYSSLFGDDYITANRVIRIEGLARQPKLVKDTDLCYLDPNLIVFQAAAFLHARHAMRSDVDPNEHKGQANLWQAMADSISGGPPYYPALVPQLPPDTKRVEI